MFIIIETSWRALQRFFTLHIQHLLLINYVFPFFYWRFLINFNFHLLFTPFFFIFDNNCLRLLLLLLMSFIFFLAAQTTRFLPLFLLKIFFILNYWFIICVCCFDCDQITLLLIWLWWCLILKLILGSLQIFDCLYFFDFQVAFKTSIISKIVKSSTFLLICVLVIFLKNFYIFSGSLDWSRIFKAPLIGFPYNYLNHLFLPRRHYWLLISSLIRPLRFDVNFRIFQWAIFVIFITLTLHLIFFINLCQALFLFLLRWRGVIFSILAVIFYQILFSFRRLIIIFILLLQSLCQVLILDLYLPRQPSLHVFLLGDYRSRLFWFHRRFFLRKFAVYFSYLTL